MGLHQPHLLTLKNLDDFHVWSAKHRHWLVEVVESAAHEIWVSTEDLRAIYPALPSDRHLKSSFRSALLYARDVKRHYITERAMRQALHKGRAHPGHMEVLKFLDWFDRHVSQAADKKRQNFQHDEANERRAELAQQVMAGPIPASHAPPHLDASTLPVSEREQWAMQQANPEAPRVFHLDARPVHMPWGLWLRIKASQALGYLASFWRGERNLFLTFGLALLVGLLPDQVENLMVPESLDWTRSHQRVLWASVLVPAMALPCALWYLVSLSRATWRSFALPGGKLWASSFYLLALPLAPMIVLAHYNPNLTEEWWDTVRGRTRPATVYADAQLGRIVVEGPIRFGSAEALQAVLARNPKYKVVQVEGPGGYVVEGFRMAQLLAQRQVDTVSFEYCFSACTFLLAAGKERYLGPKALVGFHRSGTKYGPVSLGWSPVDHEIARYYESRGVTAAFIKQALAPSIRQLWMAPHGDMFAAGYATLKWEERPAGY